MAALDARAAAPPKPRRRSHGHPPLAARMLALTRRSQWSLIPSHSHGAVPVPDEREKRAYRFGPLERRGTVGGLRLGQAVTIGRGCVLSVLLLRVLPGSQAMPAAVLVLLIAGTAAILPISGPTPDETFTARLRGEHRYRARRASQGFTSALDGEALKRPQAMPPVLRGCRLLSAHLADGSELGMLHGSSSTPRPLTVTFH